MLGNTYSYFLKNRITNEIIELGHIPQLSEEQIVNHNIQMENWEVDWTFECRRDPETLLGVPYITVDNNTLPQHEIKLGPDKSTEQKK
jgi:DNA-binding sugar fermentation-stimulating protein